MSDNKPIEPMDKAIQKVQAYLDTEEGQAELTAMLQTVQDEAERLRRETQITWQDLKEPMTI